jgi:cytochrome P450
MTKERAARFPTGSQVRLEDLHLDPYPTLARLRKLEPVSWIPEFGMWFITRFDDVEAVLHDVKTFMLEDDESLLNEIFGRTMISTDGADHTRLRRPFHPPFLPKFVRSEMSATIQARANALIDTPRRSSWRSPIRFSPNVKRSRTSWFLEPRVQR